MTQLNGNFINEYGSCFTCISSPWEVSFNDFRDRTCTLQVGALNTLCHYTVVFEKKVWLYLQKFYYVIVCVAWMILNGIKTIERRQYDPKST